MGNFCIWRGVLAVGFGCFVFGVFSHCGGERSLLLKLLQYCIVLRDFLLVGLGFLLRNFYIWWGGIGDGYLFFGVRVFFTLR